MCVIFFTIFHVPCHSLTTHCSSKGKGKEEGKSASEGENNEKVKSNSAPQDLVGSLQVSSKGKRKAEGELTSEAENDAKVKSSNVSCDCGFMDTYNISPDGNFKKDENTKEDLVSRGVSHNSKASILSYLLKLIQNSSDGELL